MNTIPSQDIKRRGISAVDDALKKGPVHVIKNNRPQYVVLSEEDYLALLDAQQDAYIARLRAAVEDVKAGRVQRFASPDDLLAEISKPE
jgi:PHD/YefM family antitoxin component YafN of YafNO toxin-antitoxin module